MPSQILTPGPPSQAPTSASVAQVLASLQNLSVTNGWDVVNIMSVPQVNVLLGQQYVANLAGGGALPPINKIVAVIETVSVQLVDVVLGNPLISFAPDQAPNEATLTLNFLSGQVNVLDGGTIMASSTITPGDNYLLSGTIPLTSVEGEVENGHDVVIDIQNGASFSANLALSSAAESALGTYLLTLLQGASGFNYTLGTVVYTANGTDLTPTSFDIATQLDLTDPTDQGRVILFIATSYNPAGGTTTALSVTSSLVPAGYGCTLLVSSKVLFGGILAGAMNSSLSAYNVAFTGAQATAASNWTASTSEGSVDVDPVTFNGIVDEVAYQYLSSNDPGVMTPTASDVTVSLAGFQMAPAADASGISLSWTCNWSQGWASGQLANKTDWTYQGDYLSMSASLDTVGVGAVDPITDEVSFTSTVDLSVSFPPSGVIDKIFGDGDEADKAGSLISTAVTTSLTSIAEIPLPEIGLFAVTNLLFPESNALSLSSVYVPGDLVIFGALESPNIQVTPLMITLADGETQAFAVTPSTASVTWSVLGSGAIDPTGLYTAPGPITVSSVDVVTATSTTDSSQTFSAAVSLVPAGVLVSPCFAVMTAATEAQVFTAVVAGDGAQTVTWSLDGPGVLTAAGQYSPPATISAAAVATVTATAADLTGSAQLFLFPTSPQTMVILPPMAPAPLGPNATQQFSASPGDAGSNSWSLLPAGVGTIDTTGLYTAPTTIDAPQTVLAIVTNALSSTIYGVAAIPLTPGSS